MPLSEAVTTNGPVPTGNWQLASRPRAIALGDSIPKNAWDKTVNRAEYGVDSVGVTLGVLPAPAGASCDGDSLTPFTIELDEPLGERNLVDPRFYPPVPLVPLREG